MQCAAGAQRQGTGGPASRQARAAESRARTAETGNVKRSGRPGNESTRTERALGETLRYEAIAIHSRRSAADSGRDVRLTN